MSYHPVEFARPPDLQRYEADFFDAAWEAKTNFVTSPVQAFALALTGPGRGVRITFDETIASGPAGNAWRFIFRQAGSSATTVDSAARTITRTTTGQVTANTLITNVNAQTGFSSALFGGEPGTNNLIRPQEAQFQGGALRHGWCVLNHHGGDDDAGVYTSGTAAPTDAAPPINGVHSIGRAGREGFYMPPGHTLYTLRLGANDIPGSASLWRLSEGEYRKYAG